MQTIQALWDWSWAQIVSVFSMSWGNLPGWKLAVGLIAVTALAAILFVMFMRGLQAFGRVAAAFWTMALTIFGILTFVVAAGLLSRGFTWVVASVPDNFWAKVL